MRGLYGGKVATRPKNACRDVIGANPAGWRERLTDFVGGFPAGVVIAGDGQIWEGELVPRAPLGLNVVHDERATHPRNRLFAEVKPKTAELVPTHPRSYRQRPIGERPPLLLR